MMLTPKLKRVMKTGVFAASFGIASTPEMMSSSAHLNSVEAIDVAPRAFAYRMAGDFAQAGWPVDAPLITVARTSVLHIMKHQVTAAEYERCVVEARCISQPLSGSSDPNLPAVQISWEDATAYASWFSAKTSEIWRLPTDEEWVFAAGSRYHDDALAVTSSRDPSVRWLARYERNRNKRLWISGRARPEPSAQMNMDCSICPGMSGNGRTPALFGNRLMGRASPRWRSEN
jgi:formylglycine-generating enzyme required for sulfatase activity